MIGWVVGGNIVGVSRFILSAGVAITVVRGTIAELPTFMASAAVTVAVCKGTEEIGVVSWVEVEVLEG
jgi:hypothetical protein